MHMGVVLVRILERNRMDRMNEYTEVIAERLILAVTVSKQKLQEFSSYSAQEAGYMSWSSIHSRILKK